MYIHEQKLVDASWSCNVQYVLGEPMKSRKERTDQKYGTVRASELGRRIDEAKEQTDRVELQADKPKQQWKRQTKETKGKNRGSKRTDQQP